MAFETVNHDVLVKKLFFYGIRGTANAWLNNYLRNINQYVIADDHSYGMRLTDTPQFRWGNPYFFSENLYQSVSFIYASMYRENVHAIHITMRFAKKIVTLCNKNRQPAAKNQNRSFTSRGATVGVGLRL